MIGDNKDVNIKLFNKLTQSENQFILTNYHLPEISIPEELIMLKKGRKNMQKQSSKTKLFITKNTRFYNSHEKGQLVNTIKIEHLSEKTRDLVVKSKVKFITRNSSCPCNSGKRFKKCCMFK